MFFRKKKTQTRIPVRRIVVLARQAADGVITYAKSCHPNEGILILQGKKVFISIADCMDIDKMSNTYKAAKTRRPRRPQ
jgi:hypothetical protein